MNPTHRGQEALLSSDTEDIESLRERFKEYSIEWVNLLYQTLKEGLDSFEYEE